MRALILLALALGLSACQTAQPVNRPCGVIDDSLADVRATTAAGQGRINRHFERGVAAKCWAR
jgi:hypothetical protein